MDESLDQPIPDPAEQGSESEESLADLPEEPDDAQVESFWISARNHAGLNPLEAITGVNGAVSLRPMAFTFGHTRALADELAEAVVAGDKRATSSWLASYEAEGIPIPEVGSLSILCDGAGDPRALIRITEVRVTPFQQVGPEVAEAEGEGTFESWKSSHEEFFAAECAQLGLDYDPNGSVVTEYFRVLHHS